MTRPEKPIFTADSINQEPFSETTTSFTAVVVSIEIERWTERVLYFIRWCPVGVLT